MSISSPASGIHDVRRNKFRIAYSEDIGRHLVAAEDISSGEIIIREPPIVKGPCIDSKDLNSVVYSDAVANQSSSLVCAICFERYNSCDGVECADCSYNIFCSQDCASRLKHAAECKVLATLSGEGVKNLSLKLFYSLITVIRCLLHRDQSSGRWEQIDQLQSKVDQLQAIHATDWLDQVFQNVKWNDFGHGERRSTDNHGNLPGVSGSWKSSSLGLLPAARHCYGVLRMNAFSDLKNSLGYEGLYFLTSLLAHSCVMNTDRQFSHKGEMVVKAAVPISKGQIITTTYVPLLNNTEQRRDEMRSAWFFECKCLRCQDEAELGTHLSKVTMNKDGDDYKLIMKNIKESLSKRMDDVEAVETWLEKFDTVKFLHTNHSLFLQVKLYLCLYYGRQPGGIQNLTSDRLNSRYKFCQQLLQVYDIVYPGIYQCKGELLFEFWLTLREMLYRKLPPGDVSCEKAVAQAAYSILKHGLPHSSYKEMCQVLVDEYPELEGQCQ